MGFDKTLAVFPVILISAYALDLVFGDPERLPHPVRWIGKGISALEGLFRKAAKTHQQKKIAGAAAAMIITGLAYAVPFLVLRAAEGRSAILFYALSVYMVWTGISVKSLGREAKEVAGRLKTTGVKKARERLKRIVGRDTEDLPPSAVCRAAAESVAENTSDGIVAPLFYLMLGGPPLMMAYKAINTLDSMVGYKNERYIYFGWASARLDDAANFIPARLTALLMVVSSFLLGYDWMRSLKILLRDRKNHPSPNSGHPEAAIAGALGVRFGGKMSYGGEAYEKPFIGDNIREAEEGAVLASVRIMHLTAFIMVVLALLIREIAIFLL